MVASKKKKKKRDNLIPHSPPETFSLHTQLAGTKRLLCGVNRVFLRSRGRTTGNLSLFLTHTDICANTHKIAKYIIMLVTCTLSRNKMKPKCFLYALLLMVTFLLLNPVLTLTSNYQSFTLNCRQQRTQKCLCLTTFMCAPFLKIFPFASLPLNDQRKG